MESINLSIKKKLEEAGRILSELRLPEAQQNERSKIPSMYLYIYQYTYLVI